MYYLVVLSTHIVKTEQDCFQSICMLLYALDWEYHNQAGSTRQNSCLDFLKLRCPITRLHSSSTNFLSLCSKQCHSESVLKYQCNHNQPIRSTQLAQQRIETPGPFNNIQYSICRAYLRLPDAIMQLDTIK